MTHCAFVRTSRQAEALTLHSEKDPFGLSRLCIDLTLIFSLIIFTDTIDNQIVRANIVRLEPIVILVRIDDPVEGNQGRLLLLLLLLVGTCVIPAHDWPINFLPEDLVRIQLSIFI